MNKTIDLNEIKSILPNLDLLPLIEEGFVAYSDGRSVVPPVGELILEKGEVHIKYGFVRSQPFYVIKIASGFYGNSKLGLSNSGGCMLVFCQVTGTLLCVLLDEGHLTNIRTAVAGAIAAKHLAPKKVTQIGIVGTGIQALAQLNHLRSVVSCRKAMVWGRSQEELHKFTGRFEAESPADDMPNFQLDTTLDLEKVQSECNLIVTTTPAKTSLLKSEFLKPGTHITAVGSDTPEKQELDSRILSRADIVVADSIEQCKTRGEISQAIRRGDFSLDKAIELGDVISGKLTGRSSDEQISVADLTGVAVQDIQIASAVYSGFAKIQ